MIMTRVTVDDESNGNSDRQSVPFIDLWRYNKCCLAAEQMNTLYSYQMMWVITVVYTSQRVHAGCSPIHWESPFAATASLA